MKTVQNEDPIVSFLDKSIEIGLYIMIFIVPLFFSKYTKQNFLLAKECFISMMVLILVALWVAKMIFNKDNQIVKSPFILPIGVFYLINFLSIFYAANKTIASYAFYLISNYAVIFFIMIYNIKSLKQIKFMLSMFTLTSGLVAFYGICQFFDIDPIFRVGEVRGNTGRSKVFSTFGNPTFLADYLVIVFPVTIGYYLDKFRPRGVKDFLKSIAAVSLLYLVLFFYSKGYAAVALLLLLSVIGYAVYYVLSGKKSTEIALDKLYGLIGAFSFLSIFLCIVITRTRGAWMGVILSFICCLGILMFIERQRMIALLKYSVILIGILSVIIVTLYYIPSTHEEMYRYAYLMKIRFTNFSTIIQRALMWQVGFDMFKDSNGIGLGIGNFKVLYSKYQNEFLKLPGTDIYKPQAVCFRHAHNEYVQLLTEVGLPGLLAFLWIFYTFLKEAFKLIKKRNDFYIDMGMIAGVIAVLVQSMFNFPFHRATPTLTVFSIMAFVALKNQKGIVDDTDESYSFSLIPAPPFMKDIMIKSFAGILCMYVILFKFAPRVRGYFEGSKALKNGYILVIEEQRGKARLPEAIRQLQKSLELDPSDREGEAHYWMGLAYEELEQYDKALEIYNRSLNFTQNKLVYFHIGLIHMRLGHFEEAEKFLKLTAGIVPSFVDAYFNLGLLFMQTGRFTEALEQFNEVLKYKKNYEPTYEYLGKIYFRMQNYASAGYYYGKFADFIAHQRDITKTPKDKETFINLLKAISMCYKELILKCTDVLSQMKVPAETEVISSDEFFKTRMQEGKYKDLWNVLPNESKTLENAKKYAESLADKKEHYEALGYFYYKLQDYSSSCLYLKKASEEIEKLGIQDKNAYVNIILKLHQSAENEMFGILKEVSALSPYDETLHYTLGLDLYYRGRFEEAADEWSKILEFKPLHQEALYHRGKLYMEMGRFSDAYNDFEKYRKFYPEQKTDEIEALLNKAAGSIKR